MSNSLWLVLEVDYDSCKHVAAFTTEEEAWRFYDFYKTRQDEYSGDVVVEEIRPTTDWRQTPCAWEVLLDEKGKIVESQGVTYTTPDHMWDGRHAHWWSEGQKYEGSVLRAIGFDEEEAVSRGRELLTEGRPEDEG